jgi:hypothetical protein
MAAAVAVLARPAAASAYDVRVTSHQAASPPATRRVLVVCAGNICRSPTGEAVLRTRSAGHPAVELEVRSRGTHGWNAGRHAHPR